MVRYKNNAYIKISRNILDSAIWNCNDKFTARDAWIDLILLANFVDKERMDKKTFYVLRRGQLTTSLRQLSERWHWNKDTVRKYLKNLEQAGQIYLDTKTHNFTLITIVNYDKYQDKLSTVVDKNSDMKSDAKSDTISNSKSDSKSQHHNKGNNKGNNKSNIKKENNKPSAFEDF